MTRRVVIEPEAERELRAARDSYERQREGLGAQFVDSIDEAIARIAALPSASTPVPGVAEELAARRMFVRRFPYTVVFIEHEGLLSVVAFAHARRKPGYWLGRIG
jgi:plasmid stabilization system protein ParE